MNDSTGKKIEASVLVPVRGRQAHLEALVNSLRNCTGARIELVVASMQPEPPELPVSLPFPVSVVCVPGERLPLAAARNAAAAKARSSRLIFLDVDCLPSPTLVQSYIQQLDQSKRCLIGDVRYLPGTVTAAEKNRASFDALAMKAVQHPARPGLHTTEWVAEPQRRALWGLSFALTKEQYLRVGGMDESYVGYGGEETDFAERLAAHGIELGWCANALALHQHHRVYSPPLDKFDDIVANATRFYGKWGNWCMEYWLGHFAGLGLIRWSPAVGQIEMLRHPSPSEIRACQQAPEVAFA